jgi:hypothetical protein
VAVVWSDFATIVGSASGALTGLLVVAVSLGVVNARLFLTR